MNAPEVWWSPSLAEALSQGGLIERTGPDLWHQENGLWHRLDELPADAVRLVPATLNSELQVGAVPDTGQAREPAPEQPDALLAAELRTLVKRYEAVARKYGDRWHGWGVEMRDTAFCLRATLEKIEQRQVESSGDTVQAPAVAALAYARSEVDKWLNDGDPYCILPTRTEHIPALLARLDELEGTS